MTTRSRRRTVTLVGCGLLGLSPLLTDCRSPTQITLELRTDANCSDVMQTTVTVGRLGEIETRPEAANTDRCDQGSGRIGSLVVVPSGDNDSEVAVRVVTGIGKSASACIADGYKGGCIVARRAIRYLPHTPLEMPVFMGIDCLDIPCGATETCFKGKCVPAEIQCSGSHCEPTAPDGGSDAGSDAPIDQSVADAGAGGMDGSGGSAGASGAGGSLGGSGGVDAGDASVLLCPPNEGSCDGDDSNGCETDLLTTSAHCGACAHDCLGGACTTGKCQPVTVWSGPSPTRLALDDSYVYFVNYNVGGVFRVSKQGGSVTTLATGQKSVRIDVDATHVYWTNEIGSQILRIPKAGGAQESVTNQANTPYGIGLSADNVYFAELRSGGSVGWVPKSGGSAPTTLSTGELWPFEVSLTATHLYWTQLANNADLRRVPLAGGAAESVLGGLANPTAIVNDGTHIYIAVSGTGANKGQVLSLPLAGGTSTTLAVNQAQPRGLAVDTTHVYWTNGTGGTVMRIAKDGSDNQTTTLMASGGIEPLGIAVDSVAVYWADDKLNSVQKVAK